jgi:hypothetical protein
MWKRLRAAASLGGYLAQCLLANPILAPARASAFRNRLQTIQNAENREALIPVQSLAELFQ